MTKFAIIGGTGFDEIDALSIDHRFVVRTPYGDPSGVLLKGSLFDKQYYFLPRHGRHHHIPPHGINYRANIWALKQKGVKKNYRYCSGRRHSYPFIAWLNCYSRAAN